MPATADQLKVARSWIGNTETDDVFNERFDRLGLDLDAAIVESLRAQLAALVMDQPAGLGLPDGTNLQYGENIRTLRENLKNFLSTGGTDPATSEGGSVVTRIVRDDYR